MPETFRDAFADHFDDQLDAGLGILGADEEEVRRRRAGGACLGGQVRHPALVDAVRVGDDGAGGRLAEDLRQRANGHDAGVDHIPQHAAGADGRELVDVADQQQRGVLGDCPDDLIGKRKVDHAGLVDDEHVAGQRVGLVVLELPVAWIPGKQAVDGLGGNAGGLAEPFGGPACGGAEHHRQALGGEDLQDGVYQRGLADAGPAGDDHHLCLCRQADGPLLLGRKGQADLPLDPGDGLFDVDLRARVKPAGQADDVVGKRHLGLVQRRQEDKLRALIAGVLDEPAIGQGLLDGLLDYLRLDFQKPRALLGQVRSRVCAVALVGQLLEDVLDTRLGAQDRIARDAQPLGDQVC